MRPSGVTLALALVALGLLGCGASEPLRIGAKSFDEQRVLAQMVASLVTTELGEPTRVLDCGDTYACQRALREGEIDAMVEYSGTALALHGAPPAASTATLYDALSLEVAARLGFSNGYALVVATAVAERDGLTSIGDLAERAEPLRVAAPSTYLGRPRDGLPSLLRRYGLRRAGRPQVLDDPDERYRAVTQGRVDAAIGYETDPALDVPALRVLEDDLGFFPPYAAELVVRADALRRFDGLRETLARLDGQLDASQMRALVADVQQEGRTAQEVARRFLSERGLAEVAVSEGGGAELPIAVHPADALETAQRRALAAARRTFPDRPTPLRQTRDIGGTLAAGDARLAVLGAERFFVRDGSALPRRDERLSAIAVLDTRTVHLLRGGDGDRVGAPPSGTGAAMLAERLLERAPAARGEPEALLERVASGELDAAVVVGPSPHPAITRALRERPSLRLAPLEVPRGPVLRPALIPVGTYPGQDEPVAAATAQVLLGAPSQATRSDAVVGPAAALRIGGSPLTAGEIARLHEALGDAELPDPALPSPWSVGAGGPREAEDATGPVFDTAANLFIVAFLGWLAWLLVQRRKPS